MVSLIIIRKKNWIGHILRHEGLLRDVIEGKMQGETDCKTKDWYVE